MVELATSAFVKELGLQNPDVLGEGKVQIREVAAGTYLMKEESHKVNMVILIVKIIAI